MRVIINLGLFQGEKTESATPKKRRDARVKGQVPQSREASSAVILLAVFAFINGFGGSLIDRFTNYYLYMMDLCADPESVFSIKSFMSMAARTFWDMAYMTLPILFVAMTIGVLVNYMQVGVLFTTEPLMPKLDRLNPLSGIKKWFSMRALTDLLKALLKIVAMVWITFFYLNDKSAQLINLFDMEMLPLSITMWKIIFDIVIRNAVFLIVISFFDYAFNRWEHEKNLRMSKQEIKEEYKQMEGDPLIKSKIKERQRQMSMRRMMQDVPKADVVITNPTHFAIAVQYRNHVDAAPKVIAKGQDLIAHQIRKIAEQNQVPIVENKPLARALYSLVQVGEFIPPDMYQAVAEVLAYVYSLKKR